MTSRHESRSERADDPVVVLAQARTPIGSFQGALSPLSATALGAGAIAAAIERSMLARDRIDRAYMGCVLPAGLGQAPARQAVLGAGLAASVQATTVNKVCGSGMQAIIMASEAIIAGGAQFALAGGMESMSNAPYLSRRHRTGARMGHDTVHDHMFLDGLEDAYEGASMGLFAQASADARDMDRAAQDAFATESLRRARLAIASGAFSDEITPVTVETRKGVAVIDTDEQPSRGDPERISRLKPAFTPQGTITAATSSSISDGAAALVLTRASIARREGLSELAQIVGTAAHAQAPRTFTTAPVHAIARLLDNVGWTVEDVDLFEINEAFACVAMFAMEDLGIAPERINVNGGATALGHPIGASGARIVVTLIAALRARGLRRGVASLCIGGGEATAIAIEIAS